MTATSILHHASSLNTDEDIVCSQNSQPAYTLSKNSCSKTTLLKSWMMDINLEEIIPGDVAEDVATREYLVSKNWEISTALARTSRRFICTKVRQPTPTHMDYNSSDFKDPVMNKAMSIMQKM